LLKREKLRFVNLVTQEGKTMREGARQALRVISLFFEQMAK
jgi:hypothetical protein